MLRIKERKTFQLNFIEICFTKVLECSEKY